MMKKTTMNFKLVIISCICVFAVFRLSSALAETQAINLSAESWDMPRHGEALLKVPELQRLMQKWMKNPGQAIELRYPGGEEGEIWVEELNDWLISLGVPSESLQLVPGSSAEDIINMVVK